MQTFRNEKIFKINGSIERIPFPKILLLASPESKVIIQTLAQRLSIQDENLFEKAENKSKKLTKNAKNLQKLRGKNAEKYKLKNKIKTRLLERMA